MPSPKPRAHRSAPAESSSSRHVKSLSKGRVKACEAASPYPALEASSSGGEVKVMVPSLEPVLALPQGPFSDVINTPIKQQVEDELKAESRKKISRLRPPQSGSGTTKHSHAQEGQDVPMVDASPLHLAGVPDILITSSSSTTIAASSSGSTLPLGS
ncbi:hypothetical protein BT96DRAFT_1008871 [Gymnopus androsaceus JB14]|uniref:Uncharacterized protein n=1 Tax=Gymnopus androsaceus JB14 TaxID=1447944 RepID=A0A6A4GE39_9AGAR|nr:hypothetical protein BT96DRAFT_1008871 [Gymnopus androsaceus JB14]